MKKRFIIIIILLLAINMIGCTKKEENELVGTWKDENRDILILKDNEEYESTHYYGKEGTWYNEGMELTFKNSFGDSSKVKYKIESKDDNSYLILEQDDLIFGGIKEIRFIKQEEK